MNFMHSHAESIFCTLFILSISKQSSVSGWAFDHPSPLESTNWRWHSRHHSPYKLYIFFRNIVQTQTLTNTHAHSSLWIHTQPYLWAPPRDWAGKSSRLTKSPQALHCQRERRLPLKAQTPLNSRKFAPTGSRTQDLKCYWGSCNH